VLAGEGDGTGTGRDFVQLGNAFGRRLTPHPSSIERLFAPVKNIRQQVEMGFLSNLAAMRRRFVLGMVALVALLGAVPAEAELTGPGTLFQPVANCTAGVGPSALGATLIPPATLPLLVYGTEIGTSAQQCATSHKNLFVIGELYLLPVDGTPIGGVMVDRTFAQCQFCNRVVALASFPPVPGLYRIIGTASVDDGSGLITTTIVGPPFIYTGISIVAPPSVP
jgi:hypothetical protein